ncbi:MAG: hypothetical protein DRP65_00380 [Planctomycetota bacterium]|nr:MAG: hypothetical protein DRP65_00380 [Planctomycetota bacterium]
MSKQLFILAIDDDRMVREVLQNALSRTGHYVYTAKDGPSGLEIAQSQKLDVILLDWMMPGMNGMEVLKQLKHDEKTRHVPVFMLTAKDSLHDIDQAVSLGVDDYIVKPFNASEIPTLIEDKLKKIKDAKTEKKRFSLTRLFSKDS